MSGSPPRPACDCLRRRAPSALAAVVSLAAAGCYESADGRDSASSDGSIGASDAGDANEWSTVDPAPANSRTSAATFDEYCAAEAELNCSMLERCCAVADVPFQREVCDRDVFVYAPAPLAWCGIGQEPVSFDAASAARCLDLRTELHRDCRFLRSDDPIAVEAERVCERVGMFERDPDATCDEAPCFAPPGMVSGCDVAFDAPGPFYCLPPRPRRSLGEACAGGAVPCDFGLYCGPGQTCARPLPDGADCVQDYECASQECTDVGTPFPRVCEPFRSIGWDECATFTDPRVSR